MNNKNPTEYDAQKVAQYFDEFGMGEWERLTKTPVDEVSLYIHSHYLQKYVVSAARVLEIGAGAGRFTQILAQCGAQIVVGDISEGQLELNRLHAQQVGFAAAVEDWRQIDICDMQELETASFDCVVAFGGPLSYVLNRRNYAIAECIRVLKPNGLLMLSVMSLWGSIHCHLDGVLTVPAEYNRRIITSGDITDKTLPSRSGNFMHLFRATELRDWLLQANLTILAMSASNCLSIGWHEKLAYIRSDESKWEELLHIELEACAEKGALDMGTHLIAVVKKGTKS